MTQSPREIMNEWFKMLDSREHAKVVKDLITPDFRLVILPESTGGFGNPSRTWAEVQEFLKELDKVIEVYGLSVPENAWIEAGDTLVGHYYSNGKLRSGSPYKNEYIGIFKFKNGKLDSFTEMMDSKYVEQVITGAA